ncbi:GntR family transcriptional regulator [Candidatus Soleaferrea massiliensis]|uniref:GntR family transcriptional regulator n=1 Tax=Candidatus Soleaferrea massiliensis TaxID=1470354 RepID=UPI00058C64BB|nr:GntR family transcriptional regulator [Candidatus Soleaferrea massiliensis]
MDQYQYRFVYQYYASRCHFGYFHKGDILPPIKQLCDKFQVSRQTIRNAFAQLQQDGYLSVSAGRRTTVVYDASEEKIENDIKAYYLARKAVMLDLNRTTMLLLAPMFEEGCRLLSAEDLQRFGRIAALPDTEVSYLSLVCCFTMLGKLQNPLAVDLANEIVLYFQFPCLQKAIDSYAEEREYSRKAIDRIAACCHQNDRQGLLEVYLQLQDQYYRAMKDYILPPQTDKTAVVQIPFHWQGYYGRPQYCYSLVLRLMRRVEEGICKEGALLPSFSAMAEEYGVSFSTVRRAVDLSNSLGITKSINGVGTQIAFSAPDTEKLRQPAILRNFDILFYSIQMITLSCDKVIGAAFSAISQSKRNAILDDLRHSVQSGKPHRLLYVSIHHLLDVYPLASIREICERLYEYLFWGYPFIRTQQWDKAAQRASIMLVEGLQKNDALLYSQGIQTLLAEMSGIVKHALKRPGI